jgi:hypothetical protein
MWNGSFDCCARFDDHNSLDLSVGTFLTTSSSQFLPLSHKICDFTSIFSEHDSCRKQFPRGITELNNADTASCYSATKQVINYGYAPCTGKTPHQWLLATRLLSTGIWRRADVYLSAISKNMVVFFKSMWYPKLNVNLSDVKIVTNIVSQHPVARSWILYSGSPSLVQRVVTIEVYKV